MNIFQFYRTFLSTEYNSTTVPNYKLFIAHEKPIAPTNIVIIFSG